MLNDLLFVLPKETHSENQLQSLLKSHPEIKFVSMVGVDLSGNETDERIPISLFYEDTTTFLKGAVQTDGSSVVLPGIASLNNAKVDMIADLDVNWFVDYNFENIDEETGKPVGTLRIPCFLYHESRPVDSRHILKRSIGYFKNTLLDLFKAHPEYLENYNVKLEFWVKTPNDKAEIEELSTSQVLQEQYWKSTKGSVRTALEQSLVLMENYGLNPEMGHKEVGGIKAKLDQSGKLTHIMEQLEIDWKYSDAVQAADNELFVKSVVRETFRRNGLDVTFLAKPIEGVAGSGEHTHVGMALKLKSGKTINLFTSNKHHYLSPIGYASVMGVLKNYEIINPFVSRTNDSLRRLKPGFEAPICIVTSLGHSVDVPSRNRTVLMGLVRDIDNPYATRFELRAPNPHSNTYLVIAALNMAMVDGVVYALSKGRTDDDLLKELSKEPGEDADYLDKGRAYRTEKDVFEDFTEEEREKYFGKAPATVYENLKSFKLYPEKLQVLEKGGVFTEELVNGYKLGAEKKWLTEITSRIILNYADEIREYKMLHSADKALDLDISRWTAIDELRHYLMKDTFTTKSLFTRVKEAADNDNLEEVSKLQVEMEKKVNSLRDLYSSYKKNLLDI